MGAPRNPNTTRISTKKIEEEGYREDPIPVKKEFLVLLRSLKMNYFEITRVIKKYNGIKSSPFFPLWHIGKKIVIYPHFVVLF